MRIFKQLVVDFKNDLLFKDTLDYVEKVFEKLGITYDDMGLITFNVSGDTNNKIIAKYPDLEKYLKDGSYDAKSDISSARTDEYGNYSLHVDKSEHQILREIVKKTPKPFNFGAISVFVDNIHWFLEINTEPCLESRRGQPIQPNAYYPQSYMSNCIILDKNYNYGKKYNPVWFIIETGNEKTGIIDTTELEEKLSAELGKPFGTKYFKAKYCFCFSEEEKTCLKKIDNELLKTYEPLIKDISATVNNADKIQQIKKEGSFPNPRNLTRASGLSLKNALRKALPSKEYEHIFLGGSGSTYHVQKKNNNNHTFGLFCDLSPSFKIFRAGLFVYGHNFRFELDQIDKNGFVEIYPNTQEEVEYHAINLAAALCKLEAGLSDELLRLYGKSIV